MMFIYYLLLSFVLHRDTRASPTPSTWLKNPKFTDDEQVTIETGCGNQYFHGTTQTFYIYNNASSASCNRNLTIPRDYKVTPGVGAHKFHSVPESWNSARSICAKEGAHLLVIDSAAEEDISAKYISDNCVGAAWIGVHELFKLDDWVTVTDQPLDSLGYVHWRQGEPNHADDGEHCIEITATGLNDMNCNVERSFICEYEYMD